MCVTEHAFYCDKKKQNGHFSGFLTTFCKPVGAGNVTRWTILKPWELKGGWCTLGPLQPNEIGVRINKDSPKKRLVRS